MGYSRFPSASDKVLHPNYGWNAPHPAYDICLMDPTPLYPQNSEDPALQICTMDDPPYYQEKNSDIYTPQQLLMINDRFKEVSTETFAKEPTVWNLTTNSSGKYNQLFNQKVLVVIHGFMTSAKDAESHLLNVASGVEKVYDAVVAYSYPTGKSPLEYGQARENAKKAAPRLSTILQSIKVFAQSVSIAAHSMGVFTAFHALNQPRSPSIDHLYSLGGAFDQKNLLDCSCTIHCTNFPLTLAKVTKIFIFYSCKDDILPLHTLTQGERTVGRIGTFPKQLLAKNVCLIDTSPVVLSHNHYFDNPHILKAMSLLGSSTLMDHTNLTLTSSGFSLENLKVCSVGYDYAIEKGAERIGLYINNFFDQAFKQIGL